MGSGSTVDYERDVCPLCELLLVPFSSFQFGETKLKRYRYLLASCVRSHNHARRGCG